MNNKNTFFLAVCCIVFIIISAHEIIKDKYNILTLKNLNNVLNSSIKAYSETIYSCRELKHNLKNDLFMLKSKTNIENQELINDLINKYNKNYDWISKIYEIPEGLQGLIYIKSKEAKQLNINIISFIDNKLLIDKKDYFNISEIIGILIDNAIEASKCSKTKNIIINIKNLEKAMEIKITNQFNNNIDLNKISELNYSTKERSSGIGLHYIKKRKKSNIKINYRIVNNLFISTLLYKTN